MILSREPSDLTKAIELNQAGWLRGGNDSMWTKNLPCDLWFAPNCMAGQPLHAAYQSFLLGKRCEQPLVKRQEKT